MGPNFEPDDFPVISAGKGLPSGLHHAQMMSVLIAADDESTAMFRTALKPPASRLIEKPPASSWFGGFWRNQLIALRISDPPSVV